jgi:toxin ParE1/3/4
VAVVYRTATAERSLDEIWLHVANDNPAAAEQLLRSFAQASHRLADFPELGEARDDLAAGVRQLSVGKYVLFYRRRFDGIELLLVLHGARDVPAAFRQELRPHEPLA